MEIDDFLDFLDKYAFFKEEHDLKNIVLSTTDIRKILKHIYNLEKEIYKLKNERIDINE